MPKFSDDPYGDFTMRVINSIRLAENQAGGMNDHELAIVEKVRNVIKDSDPDSLSVPKADIVIRPRT